MPAQIHYTLGYPLRPQSSIDSVTTAIRAAGGQVEAFDYPGDGHLFTDPLPPDEYDAQQSEILWERALRSCARA